MEHTIQAVRVLRQRASLAQRLVLRELRRMSLGRLTLTLPDGSVEIIGQSNEINANIRVISPQFFSRCLRFGDIGFGEAYVEGLWETDNLTNVIRWFILNLENSPTLSGSKRRFSLTNLMKFLNRAYHRGRDNTIRMVRRNIAEHYDLNNDFFRLFLDDTMTYSSAYFSHEQQSLEEAQTSKMDLLCRAIQLRNTDHVLEIGCGWGGFAVYAARTYGCRITSVTISKAQYDYAKARIDREALNHLVSVELKDFREIEGHFDKIVSIEMIEAVGHRYLPVFFRKCHELLGPNGVLGLQAIVCPDSRYNQLRNGVDWIQKHIFPGSLLPSVHAMNLAIRASGDLTLYNLKSFGLDYARTLSMWRDRFNRNQSQIKLLGFSDAFIRKWNYYLSYCEAAFAMRNINVMQLVYARPNTRSL